MKNTLKTLLSIIALIVTMNVDAHANTATKDIVIALNDVYVPAGFDSQTDAYVVASGIFPNGCYRWKEAQVKNLSDFEHNITSYAAVSQGMCIQVLVPFSKDIRLGRLSSGTHTLRFMSGDGTYMEKNLVIE
jgi:hypothetical protein